jgi:hypothetical protein
MSIDVELHSRSEVSVHREAFALPQALSSRDFGLAVGWSFVDKVNRTTRCRDRHRPGRNRAVRKDRRGYHSAHRPFEGRPDGRGAERCDAVRLSYRYLPGAVAARMVGGF